MRTTEQAHVDEFDSLVSKLGEDASVRAAATEALGKLRDPRTFQPLIRCLRDPSAEVRARACIALRTLGDTRAVPSLIDALRDDNEWVGKHAADALGELGDERAIPALAKANENRDRFLVCCSAATALQTIQKRKSEVVSDIRTENKPDCPPSTSSPSSVAPARTTPPTEEPSRESCEVRVPDFEQRLTQLISLYRVTGDVQGEAVAKEELRKYRAMKGLQ
jgi:HEAT repeat protein